MSAGYIGVTKYVTNIVALIANLLALAAHYVMRGDTQKENGLQHKYESLVLLTAQLEVLKFRFDQWAATSYDAAHEKPALIAELNTIAGKLLQLLPPLAATT